VFFFSVVALSRKHCHSLLSLSRANVSLDFLNTGWPKNWYTSLRLITSSNIDQFSIYFHCQNQEKIRYNAVTKDPVTPQMCHYTTL